MTDFISLTCPSCGGKLQITNDIERFACGNCGVEHIVRRSGGTVSLAPVEASLVKIGAGIDKTASELAIVRLTKEIEDLRLEKEKKLVEAEEETQNLSRSIISSKFGGFSKFLILFFGMAVFGGMMSGFKGAIIGLLIVFLVVIAAIVINHQKKVKMGERINPEIIEKINKVNIKAKERDKEFSGLIFEKEQELLKQRTIVKENSTLKF
ncbi:MAG: hypothetical protein NTZ74_05175 [Chloroflexi bacterium]|nr:hypothetical protein [Chloroflexota bacterium]